MPTYWATLRRRWLVAVRRGVAVLAGLGVGLLAAEVLRRDREGADRPARQVDALLGAADYAPDPEREVNTSVELDHARAGGRERSPHAAGCDVSAAALVGQGQRRRSTATRTSSRSPCATRRRAGGAARQRVRGRATATSAATRRRPAIEDAVASAEARAARSAAGSERDALEASCGGSGRRGLPDGRRPGRARRPQRRRPTPSRSAADERASSPARWASILAAVAIVVLARTDRRVRGEDDLEELAGAPVLATVPRRARQRRGSATPSPRSAVARTALAIERSRGGRAATDAQRPAG